MKKNKKVWMTELPSREAVFKIKALQALISNMLSARSSGDAGYQRVVFSCQNI